MLDSDDILTPGALARDLAVSDANPDIGWKSSRVLDALPDGTTAGFEDAPQSGPIERGDVVDYWRTHDFCAQVHPATLVVPCCPLSAAGWLWLRPRTAACSSP